MENPLVSVVLPAHNAQDTILRALRSAAAQTYAPLEVIVVDDASTDATAELAAAFQGLDLRVERLPQNAGASGARNRGIELSRGPIIAFLDADDEWLPEKTAAQVNVLLADPDLVFVTCEADMIRPDGTSAGLVNAGRARATGREGWKTLLQHPSIGTPCVMLWRQHVVDAGGFDTALSIGEDQDLWIRLALRGAVGHLPDVLVRVHDQPSSLSKREYRRTAATTLPMILRHLDANRDRLTNTEMNIIRAHRFTALGRNAYFAGEYWEGMKLLIRAALLGHEPFQNLLYLVVASPPARQVKGWLRGQRADTPAL